MKTRNQQSKVNQFKNQKNYTIQKKQILKYTPYVKINRQTFLYIIFIKNHESFLQNYLFNKKNLIKNNEDLWQCTQKGFFSAQCVQLIDQQYSNYLNRIEDLLNENGKNTKY
ncbi:hypothetical protein ABPG72_022014 [Tetrahymena utriculariae]